MLTILGAFNGAVVEYTQAPGNEVLLHVSELAWERTENVADVVNMGDVFQVKYLGVDPKLEKKKFLEKHFYQDLQEKKIKLLLKRNNLFQIIKKNQFIQLNWGFRFFGYGLEFIFISTIFCNRLKD